MVGCPGDCRRRRLLRHHGRLVQGGERAHGLATMAIQDRLRNYRPAGHLSRRRWQAIRGYFVRGRRLARSDCGGRARPPRPDRRARVRQRDEGFAGQIHQGRNALCIFLVIERDPTGGLTLPWPFPCWPLCCPAPRPPPNEWNIVKSALQPIPTTCPSPTNKAKV